MTTAARAHPRNRQWQVHAAAFAVAIAIAFLVPFHARAGSLDDIRARGTLVVGTKADYQPFGFRDAAGTIVGFEPDLSAEVDLVIATMNDTPERRQQVDFIEPSYYASGVNVMATKSANLHVWQQLRDKPVCSVEGAFYLTEIKDRYGPDLHLYKDTNQVYDAVKSGDCVAAYDDAAIIGQLQKPEWQDYEMPLRSILVQPWGIAVKQGNTELAAVVGDLVMKWHRTGHIQEVEKTWRIPPSIFAEEMHRRYAGGE